MVTLNDKLETQKPTMRSILVRALAILGIAIILFLTGINLIGFTTGWAKILLGC